MHIYRNVYYISYVFCHSFSSILGAYYIILVLFYPLFFFDFIRQNPLFYWVFKFLGHISHKLVVQISQKFNSLKK